VRPRGARSLRANARPLVGEGERGGRARACFQVSRERSVAMRSAWLAWGRDERGMVEGRGGWVGGGVAREVMGVKAGIEEEGTKAVIEGPWLLVG
jgi:hypothetical protein